MRILTYKRTHTGDPDSAGQFGINDCMGRIRGWNFDAVIGVGGFGTEPKSHGIEGRVNWVGLNPTWSPHPNYSGLIVTFEHFKLLESKGPMLHEIAPLLARRMYERKARVLLSSYSSEEKIEAEALIRTILDLASIAPSANEIRLSRCRNSRVRKECRLQPNQNPGQSRL